jgi:hypothetical protein
VPGLPAPLHLLRLASLCYGIEDFDGEVLVKTNAIDLLRRELTAGLPEAGSECGGALSRVKETFPRERLLTNLPQQAAGGAREGGGVTRPGGGSQEVGHGHAAPSSRCGRRR